MHDIAGSRVYTLHSVQALTTPGSGARTQSAGSRFQPKIPPSQDKRSNPASPAEETASILDFAPTVLHYLGLPVPNTMQGRVVVEAFEEPGEVRRESPPPWTPPKEQLELNLEEQRRVEERLRDLGYL